MALRILFLFLALNLTVAKADELWLVVGHETPTVNLSNKELENIFLRKSLMGKNGLSWIPLNLPAENSLRKAFSETLFKIQGDALETYWNEQYFNGISPPYVVGSEEAVIRFVSSTPGALGYILPCHSDARVKVLFKLSTRYALNHFCH